MSVSNAAAEPLSSDHAHLHLALGVVAYADACDPFTLRKIIDIRACNPFAGRDNGNRYLEGLRLAGMSE